MKTAIATLILIVAASTLSLAGTCYTNCYWIGNQQHCTTTCY